MRGVGGNHFPRCGTDSEGAGAKPRQGAGWNPAKKTLSMSERYAGLVFESENYCPFLWKVLSFPVCSGYIISFARLVTFSTDGWS